jgi:hypothetical protein
MRYIKRNELGQITAVSSEAEPGFVSEEAADVTDIAAFFNDNGTQSALRSSDLEFIRVVDDLLDVLFSKGLINFTDLPTKAQQKFIERGRLREQNRDALTLLGDDGDEFLDL